MTTALRAALATVAILAIAPRPPQIASAQGATAQAAPSQPAGAELRDGQSITELPDGRWLLIGGRGQGRPSDVIRIWDPATGHTETVVVRLARPRANHTATLLSDGRVLVLGGVDGAGRVEGTAELFDVDARNVERVSVAFTPRSEHSTTLLTDGRLLIAGGIDDLGNARADAELWDPITGQASDPIYMLTGRRGHAATLLGDGSVRIGGGGADDERFDPDHAAFVSRALSYAGTTSNLGGSLPADGATNVVVDTVVALRFSDPLPMRAINSATVTIAGPAGVVAAYVQPAEGGRLVFVKPAAPLDYGTSYTVSVLDRALGAASSSMAATTIAFTTAAAEAPRPTTDNDDAWRPNPAAIGREWRIDRAPSRWQQLPPLQAPPGVTALAGQVLLLNGQPLANVTLQIEGRRAKTDNTGRFLLLVPGLESARREIVIDGTTANRRGRTYGVFEYGHRVSAGRTNVLPFTIWMPRIDTAHAVTIPSPTGQPTVVTTPLIPGLELHLAPNTVIRDRDGSVVRQLSITPIPVDRPPFPLPRNSEVPIYFTVQPGGAYVHVYGQSAVKGARLVYPNYTNQKPGETMDFWHYDPEEKGWHVYGKGSVNAAGTQVVPDPGIAIYEFTGAMIASDGSPPPWWPSPGGRFGADPVDLATGLFVYQRMDLLLPDVMPLAFSRTYRPSDPTSRSFGRGSRHVYDMDLWRPNISSYEGAAIILADGQRINYDCLNPDDPYLANLRFEHTETPGPFYKSTFKWQGFSWWVTLLDGTVYEFGDNAPLQSIRDRYGNAIKLIRESGQHGKILKLISPHNRWIAFTYDGSNRITQAKDNLGRTVGYEYDGSGRLWKVTDAAGGVTEYAYDASHRMLTVKDPRGITYLTNVYDANGRVEEQTLADTGVYTFDYTLDGSGNVTQTDMTDPEGRVQRLTFNGAGFALTVTDAYGTALARTTTYTYQSGSNHLLTVVDPLSRHTEYTYDSLGNRLTATELVGTADEITTTYTYDPAYNQVATVTDPLNHTTTFAYDHLGRMTSVTDPLSHQAAFTYNNAGQPLTVTDAVNKTTTFGYTLGNLTSITSPLGNVETRFVDSGGRLLRVTDPGGAMTRFEYNAVNQVTKIVDPINGETTFTYDGNGNLLTLTDARNKTTTWTYNNMDRVETRTDPLSRDESFAYDLLGNLTSWTDRKGQLTTYQYDDLNRQTFIGFGTTGAPPSYSSTITTTFDAGDRPTEIVDSVAGTIERTYDLLDRLTEEVMPEGTVTYTYDDAGRRASMTVAGQTAVSYTFDDANRLTGITRGSASVSLVYDNADRRTSLTLPNGIVVEYAYDDDSRLTGLTYKQGMSTLGTLTYGYDADGQRTSVGGTYARSNLPAALGSATYDDANQIATFGGTSFTYDDNGNLTSDGTRSYTWNARNQLASLTGPVNGSFAYDAVGRRRSKTIGSTTTQFLYDGLNPVQELASGTPTGNLLTGLDLDEFFTRTDGGGVRNYLIDALGSSVALLDGSGTVQTEYTYEPFGATSVTGASTTSAHGFTGRENDGTGLYYYRARYYHPSAQRFVSDDPLGFAGGDTVLSAYVANSPTNFSDSLGLQKFMSPPMCEPGQIPSKTVMNDMGVTCIEMMIGIMPMLPTGPLFGRGGAGGGGGAGKGGGEGPPPLRPLHGHESTSKASRDYWSKQSTDDILDSLKPGAKQPLQVKPDGTIMDGNTRVRELMERGYPTDSLPRVPYPGGGGK
jgi:RHS repeat-associated protein